jgi:hypothetical protein
MLLMLQVSVQECVEVCIVRWWEVGVTEVCIQGPDLDAFTKLYDQHKLPFPLPRPTQFAVPQ